MISLDYSIIPAILLFLMVVVALNYLLFRPLLRVQAERALKTSGQMELAQKHLDRHLDLFNRYQMTIKNARLEGYRLQEQVRSEASKKRTEALDRARKQAEALVEESRASIQSQVLSAKDRLSLEAGDIARGIAETVLQRSA